LIDGNISPEETISNLTKLLNEKQVDLGLIGIGENGHIAFNDPPADFEDSNFYKVVNLSDTCKAQQIREGWFNSPDEVFKQAISMTCSKIMDTKTIICAVPYKQKAQAVHDTLTQPINNNVPATLLKNHDDVTVYIDQDSASLLDSQTLKNFS
jgi:glucosamine-6-phosphate deaminase